MIVIPSLQQFLDTARRLADVAKFDSIRLGVVATDKNPGVVLALSASLIRKGSQSPSLPSLRAGGVVALQVQLPLENLEHFLARLEENVLDEFTPALRLQSTLGQISWNFVRAANTEWGRSSMVQSSSPELPAFAQPVNESIDEQIAQGSDYAYSSLTRLIKAYTGLLIKRHEFTGPMVTGNRWDGSRLELIAPWPVQAVTSVVQGPRLRVDVDGLSGLETERFILNVEGVRQDRRLDGQVLRWQETPTRASGLATYTTAFDVSGIEPTAVNLYVSGAPTVMLKAEVQQEQPPPLKPSSDGLYFVMDRARPVRYETPEGIHLTRFQVGSFRLLRSVELGFENPFVVLVGPNQSGKSSVLDALQLLSDAARGELSEALVRRRGGLGSLLTRGSGSTALQLEAEFQATKGPNMRYRLELTPVGAYDFAVTEELAQHVGEEWVQVMARSGARAVLAGAAIPVTNEREAILSQLGGLVHPLIESLRSSLAAIAVYPYFRTGASWADPEAVPMRRPVRLEPGARLDRTGSNLAAALSAMRDERPADWEQFLGIVRLAFPQLKDLRIPAVTRGTVQLFWDEDSGQSFEATELSDGTLSFLAILCALFQPGSALIAVDEPEQHLHPDALRRLMGAARSLSLRQPILFTTQSDSLIALLDDAPESVLIASRQPDGTASLVRPDLEQLQEWLKSFSLREMRRELEGWGKPS